MKTAPQDDSWDPVATAVVVWLGGSLVCALLVAHLETVWPGFLAWVFLPIMFVVLCWMAVVTHEDMVARQNRQQAQERGRADDSADWGRDEQERRIEGEDGSEQLRRW